MRVELEMRGDIAVVRPVGDMDQSGLPAISREVTRVLDGGGKRFVFDFGRVTFIDSMGAAYLLMTCKRARERGGDVVLASIPKVVRRTFDVLGLLEVFRAHDGADAAAASFAAARAGEQ